MYFHIYFQTLSSPLRSPLSPVPPVITDERFNLLCPQPKQIHQLSDEQNFFPDRMTISISPGRHSIHEYVLHQRYLLPLMYCPVQSTVVVSLTPSWCVLTRFFSILNFFSLKFGAFHAPCFPGMTLLYLPCDMLKLMLTFLNPGLTFLNPGLTFLNPGLTFLRPGLRKVLLSHRHLGISQLSVSIYSSLSPYL